MSRPAFLRSDAMLAMGTRAVQGGALSLSGVLVILQLSATDQGFYFAFISFGILLQLCDFGLSYASLQSASHLLAQGRADELPGLCKRASRINASSTAIATVLVVALGTWTFTSAPAVTTAWVAPWLCFIAGVAINHLAAPAIFVLEGGVSVTRAWQLRLLQEVAAGCALLVVLAAGLGLWSLVAYYWMRTAIAALWLRRFGVALFDPASVTLPMRSWLVDLWPFQWRVGVGAVSNFLVFQAFGPILFALHGPTEAGRFSLSLAVMNALVMVTTAWPISQAAHFGVMLGKHDAAGVQAHWKPLLARSTLFATASALLVGILLLLLRRWHPDLMTRFAGPTTTSLLIASAVAHHATACFSVVLRAEQADPLMLLAVVGGLVTLLAMTIAAATGAADATALVALVYFVSTVTTMLLARRVYLRFARRRFVDATPLTA